MFSAFRLWRSGVALIACACTCATVIVAAPSERDLASLIATEESLAEAHRESDTLESRWAWIEAIARVAWAQTEAGNHGEAANRYRAAIAELPDEAETLEPEFVALLHDGLGRACQNNGEFDQAEVHLRAGLNLRARQSGEGAATRLGVSEGHLGLLELVRGRYAEAERLFRSALQHTPEDRGDLLALRHDCLGRYYLALRAHELATMHYEKAIAYATGVAWPDDTFMADLRTNLALCRFRGGDAESALAEVSELLMTPAGEGPARLRRVPVLNLAATIHASLGEVAEAQEEIEQAVAIVSEEKGEKHPALAPILGNLGAVRIQAGDAAGALAPLERARTLLLDHVSEHHQELVEVLYQIAACRLESGSTTEAGRKAVVEARAAAARLMEALVKSGSERELLTFREQVDLHSIVCRLGEPELIADSLLGGKGRIMEAVLDRRTKFRQRMRRVEALQAELDQLLLGASPAPAARVAALRDEIEQLSAEAAAGAGETHNPIRWQQVAAAVPEGSAYVDCVRYIPSGAAADAARYGAVVFLRDSAPRWIPLGEERMAGRLELLHRSLGIRANILRQGGGRPGIPMAPLLGDLHRAFWQPIAEALPEGTREVILCPEGKLHLLPFAVLRGSDGRSLCESLPSLRVVDSGRGLIRTRPPAVAITQPWMALGVADFEPHRRLLREGESSWSAAWSAALEGIGDLPTVRSEIESVRKLAPKGSVCLVDADARESALRDIATPPAVLHFASHGFNVALSGKRDLAADPSALYENGILLGPGGGDDGILFPEEAGALDLRGTELVTLSTCRGALGRPVSGEGVLGLRRGFAKAGARHVLASLWEIPDRSTAEFMTKYYASLKSERSPNPPALLWRMQAERLGAVRGEDPTGEAMEVAILSFGGFVMSSE